MHLEPAISVSTKCNGNFRIERTIELYSITAVLAGAVDHAADFSPRAVWHAVVTGADAHFVANVRFQASNRAGVVGRKTIAFVGSPAGVVLVNTRLTDPIITRRLNGYGPGHIESPIGIATQRPSPASSK